MSFYLFYLLLALCLFWVLQSQAFLRLSMAVFARLLGQHWRSPKMPGGPPNSELPGQFTGEWGVWTFDAGFHAMPSGHSADVFTGAVLLALVLQSRKLRFLLLGIAILAGFSRVAVAAHWPSDVLVGGLIGSCCAYVHWSLSVAWLRGVSEGTSSWEC